MQIFTNSALTTSDKDREYVIYECPASTNSTIHNLLITNSDSSITATVNLKLQKGSSSFFCIPSDFQLDPKNTLEMKPVNLIHGDKLTISSTTKVDVIASILEEKLAF